MFTSQNRNQIIFISDNKHQYFFLHLTQKMFCKNCSQIIIFLHLLGQLFFICEICRQNFFLLQINNTMIKWSHVYTLIGYNNAYLNTSIRSYPTFDHPDHSTPCTVIFWSAILSISRLYNFITMPRKN